jgi:hypothetical protein
MIDEIAVIFQQEPQRPFPYDEIRTLKDRLSAQFKGLSPDASFSADLNEHLSLIAGLASGGIAKYLAEPLRLRRITQALNHSFYDRYPQYRFLGAADLSDFPNLQAELRQAERLRLLLRQVVQKAEGAASPHLSPGPC